MFRYRASSISLVIKQKLSSVLFISARGESKHSLAVGGQREIRAEFVRTQGDFPVSEDSETARA